MFSIEKRLSNFFSKNQGRTLIFLNNKKHQTEVILSLKKHLQDFSSDFEVILFEFYPDYLLEKLNKQTKYSHDFLTKEEGIEIDDFVYKDLGNNWFKFKIAPNRYVTEYKNILLGKFVWSKFSQYNINLVRHIATIRNILSSFVPQRILIIEDSYFLRDIVKLFWGRYSFTPASFNLQFHRELFRPNKILQTLKSYLADIVSSIIDFLVLRFILYWPVDNKKIIIDSRFHKIPFGPEIKDYFILCPFEKGLKMRLKILFKGSPYLPFYTPSHFTFLQRNKRFRQDWNSASQMPDFREIFRFKDVVFWDVVEKYLSEIFLVTLPRIMANILIFQKVAIRKKIKLLVMRNDLKELENSLICFARASEITSLVIQHGILAAFNIADKLRCDILNCWGNASIDKYQKLETTFTKLIVTGNPAYDELYYRMIKRNTLIKSKVCKDLGLAIDKKIISFLTVPKTDTSALVEVNETEFYLETVLRGVKDFPELQLIIKVHPYDDIEIYKNYLYNYYPVIKNKISIVREYNIFDILETSDAVIITDSTSGLEALILEKPLIKLNLARFGNLVPYVERGCAVEINRKRDPSVCIKDVLYNYNIDAQKKLAKQRESFVFDYAYKIDGRAVIRTEELMRGIIENDTNSIKDGCIRDG